MRRRLTRRPGHTTIAAYLALFVALGGTTYAATGGNFILGQPNSAGSTTALSSGTTGPALKVTSTNTGAGATALGLNVPTGHAPLTVNSGTKVAKLNADKLDGKDSTNWKTTDVLDTTGDFLPGFGTFTSSGGKLLIMASGSGYRSSSSAINPGRIGVDVYFDHVAVSGADASAFTNELNSHKTFTTNYTVISGIPAGSHTVGLVAKSDSGCGSSDTPNNFCTTVDASDSFHVAVIEIPS
jgi:hypothetical protein